MTKTTFMLKMESGNKDYKLVVAPHQSFSEEELVSKITPLLNEAGHHRGGLSYRQYDAAPKWILTKPDKDGIRHRKGLRVPKPLFNKFLTELINHGYRVIPIVSDKSPFKL